jgi:hypothetical protein
VLPPGGEGEVEVTLTPRGSQEHIVKRIVVVSNDPEQPRFVLTMQGKLHVDVRTEPANLVIPEVAPGHEATLSFAVVLSDPNTTAIESVVVEDQDNFELRPLAAEAAGQQRYELRLRSGKGVGSYGTRVEIKTTGRHTPELNVPVRASVVSNLRYAKRIHFMQQDGAFGPRQVRISTRDGTAPTIAKVEDPDGLLDFEILPAKGATVSIEARLDEAKLAALDERERGRLRTLIVHTDDPDEPRVEIMYKIGALQARVGRLDAGIKTP